MDNVFQKTARLFRFKKKDSALGVAREKREYDIPLNKKMGSEFLTLLIGLMTFLAILALSGSFVLSDITHRWTTGLENQLTIEIPAETSDGKILSFDEIYTLSTDIDEKVKELPFVKSSEALDKLAIQELLEPWLGENANFQDLPLPGLVSVELESRSKENVEQLEQTTQNVYSQAHVNTHQQWLKDIVNFTETLNFTALLITLVIAFTTFTAVAGAIKSRIAAHYEELELLHLMGATDSYISRQFQRHAFLLAMKGAILGLFIGLCLLGIIHHISKDMDAVILPNISLGFVEYASFIILPFVIALIAMLTARHVALRELSAMP